MSMDIFVLAPQWIANFTPSFMDKGFDFVGMNFSTFTCIMMLYSFFGWFYETTIFSLCEQGKIINRGYFVGPYCPIYGVVILGNMYLLSDVHSTGKIFLMAFMTCTVVEYATSYVLEKLFDARYWDYNYYPLNINGRVSVPSSAFFCVAITLMIKVFHPFFIWLLGQAPTKAIVVCAVICHLVFWTDSVITFICMNNLNAKCRMLYDAWDDYVDEKLDHINEKTESLERFTIVRRGQKLLVKAKNVNQHFLDLETRYIRNVGFKSTKYGELIDKMRERFVEPKHDDKEDKKESSEE